MLLYRIEDEDGNGPYTGDSQGVRHEPWYKAPSLIYCGNRWVRAKLSRTRGKDGRYTHVLAMESLEDLLIIFRRTEWTEPTDTFWVSVYKVHKNATKTLYSIDGDSKQIQFNRTKATLVERFELPLDKLRGHLYDSCPPHLYHLDET